MDLHFWQYLFQSGNELIMCLSVVYWCNNYFFYIDVCWNEILWPEALSFGVLNFVGVTLIGLMWILNYNFPDCNWFWFRVPAKIVSVWGTFWIILLLGLPCLFNSIQGTMYLETFVKSHTRNESWSCMKLCCAKSKGMIPELI